MKASMLFKGVGLGMIAGATIAATVMPIDKRRFMRSKVGRVVKGIGNAAHNIGENFS